MCVEIEKKKIKNFLMLYIPIVSKLLCSNSGQCQVHFGRSEVLVIQLCLILCNPMDCSQSSQEYSRQEYWSGEPFLSPGDLPGITAFIALVTILLTTMKQNTDVMN